MQQVGTEAAIVGDDRQTGGRVVSDFARQREEFQRQFEGGVFQRDVLGPRCAARLRRFLVLGHLADLHVGAEAAGQQLDVETGGGILA